MGLDFLTAPVQPLTLDFQTGSPNLWHVPWKQSCALMEVMCQEVGPSVSLLLALQLKYQPQVLPLRCLSKDGFSLHFVFLKNAHTETVPTTATIAKT